MSYWSGKNETIIEKSLDGAGIITFRENEIEFKEELWVRRSFHSNSAHSSFMLIKIKKLFVEAAKITIHKA